MLDLLGIGFGPSNVALAAAMAEGGKPPRALFLEAKERFGWHPGMLLDGARMQISFLKDLVTLRNPESPYSFLVYLKAKGRLEEFANLREFYPSRIEFQDYLRWVAGHFEHQAVFGARVASVSPDFGIDGMARSFTVRAELADSGEYVTYQARNVVYAPGGTPNRVAGVAPRDERVIHTAEFLERFPKSFPDHSADLSFAVVGGGQSAAEIIEYILAKYPLSRVHAILPGYSFRPADDSPYSNEVFFSAEVDDHFTAHDQAARLAEARSTNYGVVDLDLIEDLYRMGYEDQVRGNVPRLTFCRSSRLLSADAGPSGIEVTVGGPEGSRSLNLDGLVLATGYHRELDPEMFRDVIPHLQRNESGNFLVSRAYRADSVPELTAGIYFQGLTELSHGIGDTLLSLLSFRSAEIAEDVRKRSEVPSADEVEYPPARHIEPDRAAILETLQRFPLATLISSDDESEVFATHLPLILDRERGEQGVLFGHLDVGNPQVPNLNGRRVLAVFHGPNSYISPRTYTTDQLPTWNYVAVHVRGHVRVLENQDQVVSGLASISEKADRSDGAYRLDENDSRIEKLIGGIVGFELDIESLTGRFKLSQDRSDEDRKRAMAVLREGAGDEHHDFVARIHQQ